MRGWPVPARFRREEGEDRVGDVLGLADAAQCGRGGGVGLVAGRGEVRRAEVGAHDAWRDVDDADAAGTQLGREVAAGVLQRRLRRRLYEHVRVRAARDCRAHGDDARVRREQRQRGADQQPRAAHIDRHRAVESSRW